MKIAVTDLSFFCYKNKNINSLNMYYGMNIEFIEIKWKFDEFKGFDEFKETGRFSIYVNKCF